MTTIRLVFCAIVAVSLTGCAVLQVLGGAANGAASAGRRNQQAQDWCVNDDGCAGGYCMKRNPADADGTCMYR